MFLREKDENDQASQEAVEIEKQRAWQLRNSWDDWIGATPVAWSSKLHHMESAVSIEWTSCNLDS